ncbi:MAG: efflux RND transporter permease subunit [Lachnospiraceae bacterium]|nr:efflux RND transporter permease subunit [Lachnospiraceae bacterium]
MLSKFSVKKPYTVVVGIVMILVLGYVAFTSMTTDLLPNINLPYAIVYTTYPGASPETVEETLTKPIEQAMATVSNIENITSTSSENVSMVVLEFSQTTNMDSVSLEMRENLDQISGYWGDTVGKPIIMKLNPSMMPVMVAAIEKEGLEGAALSDYINDTILSDMESLEGVASVSTSGEVEQSVEVVLRQEKIDAVNAKIQNALNGKFDDAQEELDDAKAEIQEGKDQLESGKNEMESQIGQAADAQAQIAQGEAEIENGLAQLDTAQSALDKGKEQLQEQKNNIQGLYDQAESAAVKAVEADATYQQGVAGIKQLEEGITQAKAGLEQLEKAKADAIAAAKKAAEQMGIPFDESMLESNEDYQKLIAQITEVTAQIAVLEEQKITAQTQMDAAMETAKTQARAAVDTQIAAAEQKIVDGQAQIDAGKAQLQTAKSQLLSGKITLAQAQSQIEAAKIEGTLQMASAQAQLDSADAKLDEGQDQLDESKEDALDAADVKKTLTADTIKQILQAQNFTMPAGYVTEEGIDYLVRVGDEFSDANEMQNMTLVDMNIDGLEPIRLSDVADVAVTDNSDEVYATINGHAGVLLSVQKQTGYSTGDVADRLNAYFANLDATVEGNHTTVLMDQGVYISMVVDSVLQNMLFGGILAIFILLLFLRDLRPTLVVACSIPISIMASIVLMYFSGVTLNVISLSGLALGVGMLVDNSIVVIENVYRLRNLGVPARKAAVEGARQVAGAIVASTLTTVCVFAPIVFTEGITRQLFVDMGLTIAYSLLSSLVVALTLVPMMSAGVLRNTKEKEHKLFDRIQNIYGRLMEPVLRFKPVVLILALALLGLSAWMSVSKGTAFMPTMESTQTSISLTMPEGSTLTDTGAMADTVAERIMTISDVEDVGAMAGGGSGMGSMMGGSGGNDTATMYVILKEKMELSNEELKSTIEDMTKDLDCEINVETSSMDMSALGGSGVTVQIKGRDLDELQTIAKDVAGIVEKVPGTMNVSDGIEDTTEELRLIVDKDKASQHNLTVAQVFQQVNDKIKEANSATTLSTISKDFDVLVFNEEKTEFTRDDVKNLTITAKDQEGNEEEVPLADIGEFVSAEGLQSIGRDAQSRYISVTAGIDEDHNIGLVADEVETALADYETPDGYTIEMQGEDETINEAMVELLKMLALAILFMYLIMVAQFQSLLSPFIVMFTIPLAFTGGFFGLVISNSEVSVIALIGFVMLSGIIVNNGIVLVDYINQLRAGGMNKHEAIIEAGKTRMRPIMMTALTTILGLSTMAMGMGMGADMAQPMAIVTIGGLIYGTLLTLFVVPCIYDIFNRKKYKKSELELLEEEETGKIEEQDKIENK